MSLSQQRLVLDANVIVSSVLSAQGKSRQVFDLAISTGIVLMSDDVFAELSEVLLRPKFNRYSNRTKREAFLDELLELVEFVEITEQIDECRDVKDNKYLELAVSGDAELDRSQDWIRIQPVASNKSGEIRSILISFCRILDSSLP